MTFTRVLSASTIAVGLGLGAVFGIGTASADPGGPCNAPGAPACQGHDWNGPDGGHGNDRGPAPVDWQHRGVDQGRQDHQPFDWNGQQVTPIPAGNGAGWGFWFLGTWIPL